MTRTILFLLLSAFAAWAADVTGNWKATAEGPNGSMERTLTLKVEGAKLTGETVSTFTGKSTIENGKVDGDSLSFTIKAKIQDNEMTLAYTGKVINKDEIKFTSKLGDSDNTIEWVAKRTN